MRDDSKSLSQIASYYSDKVLEFGATPHGVDWNGERSQSLRFEQLCKILPNNSNDAFSINDLGCGYGALNHYLREHYNAGTYTGYDISKEMILAAQRTNDNLARYICAAEIETPADFGIASGIFNVKLEQDNEQWLDYIIETVRHLNSTSTEGFAFNCLTSYSDHDKMRDHLYYANPSKIFDLCKCEFSKNVALLHDYELYEFTILVRK